MNQGRIPKFKYIENLFKYKYMYIIYVYLFIDIRISDIMYRSLGLSLLCCEYGTLSEVVSPIFIPTELTEVQKLPLFNIPYRRSYTRSNFSLIIAISPLLLHFITAMLNRYSEDVNVGFSRAVNRGE